MQQAFFYARLNANKFSELLFIFLLTYCEHMFIILVYQTNKCFNSRNADIPIESQVKSMSNRHYRVVKPVRFFIFVLISIMIIIFAGYGILNIGKAQAATVNTYERVIVQENDTLWDLAETYNPDVKVSYQKIIHDICETNDIESGDIHPGDILFIPVY